MAKMTFSKSVKYNNVYYPANTPIEVEDKDIVELKRAGGFVIEGSVRPVEDKPKPEEQKESAAVVKESAAKVKLPPTKKRNSKKDK